jgi:hypothetical protein
MGEMTFIKNGFATTIGRDGEVTTTVAVQCDGCFKWSNGLGGLDIKDIGQEVVLWLCAECRK